MTERLYVRQITENHWQWRMQFANGSWDDALNAGTLELLAESLPNIGTPICVLIPGSSAVVRNVPVEGTEKRHLAKLIPYEMEEELIDPVEDLHFCYGHIENDHVNLVYLKQEDIRASLEQIELVSSEVQHLFPEYFVLNVSGVAATFVLEDELVMARFANGTGFAVEINLAPMVLESLSQSLELEACALNIVADSEEGRSMLKSCLPETWLADENIEILEQEGSFWDCIDDEVVNNPLNLRSGFFGRQLPLDRWWRMWQIPAYVAAAAFVLSLVVNFSGYLSAKGEAKEIREQIRAVYQQAVPKGRKGDEEKRLMKILGKKDGAAKKGEQTNLLVMLSGLSKSLASQKNIHVSNFRYNGEQRELQVNIEVKGLGELGEFRELLTRNGLESGSPRTSRQGEIYQANIKLKEKP